MNAKDFKAKMAWLNSSEAKKRNAAAKAHAISEFKKLFPNANMSMFEVRVYFNANRKATGTVYFRESKDSLADPLLVDRKYWSQAMKDALGMHQDGGLPYAGNLIDFIRNDQGVAVKFEYFVQNYAQGLTQTGLSRLNQSIEAFVYCVLGAQVNVRSNILGNGGRAKEAQSEFLVLVKNAIRTPDISKSVQRYRLAVDEAKVRLDFATSPGSWLMPSRMVINTESTIGYNNQLKQATPDMKLGVKSDTNLGTKKASIKPMDGGPSKINPPNSHPSNPIHKQAMEALGLGEKKSKTPALTQTEEPTSTQTEASDAKQTDSHNSHHINKAIIAVGAVVLARLVV